MPQEDGSLTAEEYMRLAGMDQGGRPRSREPRRAARPHSPLVAAAMRNTLDNGADIAEIEHPEQLGTAVLSGEHDPDHGVSAEMRRYQRTGNYPTVEDHLAGRTPLIPAVHPVEHDLAERLLRQLKTTEQRLTQRVMGGQLPPRGFRQGD